MGRFDDLFLLYVHVSSILGYSNHSPLRWASVCHLWPFSTKGLNCTKQGGEIQQFTPVHCYKSSQCSCTVPKIIYWKLGWNHACIVFELVKPGVDLNISTITVLFLPFIIPERKLSISVPVSVPRVLNDALLNIINPSFRFFKEGGNSTKAIKHTGEHGKSIYTSHFSYWICIQDARWHSDIMHKCDIIAKVLQKRVNYMQCLKILPS